MPNGDPWVEFFYPTLTLMMDSYIPARNGLKVEEYDDMRIFNECEGGSWFDLYIWTPNSALLLNNSRTRAGLFLKYNTNAMETLYCGAITSVVCDRRIL